MRTIVPWIGWMLLAGTAAAAEPPLNATGVPNAPIVIEVYSDFQCPGCKTLHEATLQPLSRDYVGTGKVYLIHREFPLPGHPHARQAAAYAAAAGRSGRYQQVADALFARQAYWSANGAVDEVASSVLAPEQAKKVRLLVKDPAIAAAVARDMASGQAAGIRQTPTLIITHRLKRYPLSGTVRYDLLRRFLDDLLAK